MTNIKKNLSEIIAKNHNNTYEFDDEDLTKIEELLEELMMSDEYIDKYHPCSENKVKKPGRKMGVELRELGFDLISGPTLNELEYKFTFVTGYAEHFGYITIIIDYWNRSVRYDD